MTTTPDDRLIRALLVDDEDLARGVLREYCARHEDVEIVGECANGFEAVQAIEAQRPDVVFLDVQMPRLDGFEVLELIEAPPLIVFVTAHDEYALAAFDVHACDYLQKPFAATRFDQALERVRERRRGRWQVDAETFAQLHDSARGPDAPLARVAVRRGGTVEVIPVARLDLLEARDDYVALHVGERSWLKPKTMSWFEQHLDPKGFLRVHRSYIINLARLRGVEAVTRDSHVAVLEGGQRVPVSKAGHKRLREVLG